MQTKRQIMDKFHELMSRSNEEALSECNRLLASGAIDLERYEDNYVLPKILATAILRKVSYSWEPLSKEGKQTVKNLVNF